MAASKRIEFDKNESTLILIGLAQCNQIPSEIEKKDKNFYSNLARNLAKNDTSENKTNLLILLSESCESKYRATAEKQYEYYQKLSELTKVTVADLMPSAEKAHLRKFIGKSHIFDLHQAVKSTNKTPRKDFLVAHIILALDGEKNDTQSAYLLALAKLVRRGDVVMKLTKQGADTKNLPADFAVRFKEYMKPQTMWFRQNDEERTYGVKMDPEVEQVVGLHDGNACNIL